MDELIPWGIRILGCAAGAGVFPLVGATHPNVRNWLAASLPAFFLAIFCEPLLYDFVVFQYGEELPWIVGTHELNAHFALSFAFSFSGYGVMRTSAYMINEALPYTSDNVIVQIIIRKIRSILGLPEAPKGSPWRNLDTGSDPTKMQFTGRQ